MSKGGATSRKPTTCPLNARPPPKTHPPFFLSSLLHSLPEDVARFVFQQLVVAVDFIHKKGKVNRDIKLANVSHYIQSWHSVMALSHGAVASQSLLLVF